MATYLTYAVAIVRKGHLRKNCGHGHKTIGAAEACRRKLGWGQVVTVFRCCDCGLFVNFCACEPAC